MCLAELRQLYCLTELSNHGNAVKQELKHLEHERTYPDMKDSWEHPLRITVYSHLGYLGCRHGNDTQ